MSRVGMDYSFLFSNTNSSQSTGNNGYSWISEYSNIKNGTYYKVLKAYYAKQQKTSDDSTTTNKTRAEKVSEQEKTLDQIQVDAKSLTAAAETLTAKGSLSIFNQKDVTKTAEDGTQTTVKGYDTDAIYKAVKSFADSYNKLLDSASSSSTTSVLNQTLHLTNMTKSYERLLGNVGVTIGENNKLSVDADKLKSADMTTVKTLFNGNASYANSVATKASMINASAKSAADQSSLYTGKGTYDKAYSTGNLLNSIL